MFSVRCRRDLTYKYFPSPCKESYEILARSLRICSELKAEILLIQTPPSFNPDERLKGIRDLLSSVDFGSVRLAWEIRGCIAQGTIKEKNPKKAYLTFHGAKMYKDAARLKVYQKSGTFPDVTKTKGLESLKSVVTNPIRCTMPASTVFMSIQDYSLLCHNNFQKTYSFFNSLKSIIVEIG